MKHSDLIRVMERHENPKEITKLWHDTATDVLEDMAETEPEACAEICNIAERWREKLKAIHSRAVIGDKGMAHLLASLGAYLDEHMTT